MPSMYVYNNGLSHQTEIDTVMMDLNEVTADGGDKCTASIPQAGRLKKFHLLPTSPSCLTCGHISEPTIGEIQGGEGD